jgi:hypothetical protein
VLLIKRRQIKEEKKKMLREKFNELLAEIEKGDNLQEDSRLIEDIIADCGRYIERVNAMEGAITAARFRMEPEDYRAYIVELDRQRKIQHDSLIVSVRVLNRLCNLYNVPRIYQGDVQSRIEIAEFARNVVNELFDTRKL